MKKEINWKKILNSEIFLLFKDLLIIIIIVLSIRFFIAMPFKISGDSMKDSYYDEEFIIVDRFSYLIWTPKRWDVIVFRPHVNENKEYFLKRIIWIPWDKLKIEDWYIFIQPKWKDKYIKINEPYLNSSNNWNTFAWIWSRKSIFELWKDDYFVIWDNRNHSTDSRECFWNCSIVDEFISESDIIWKVFLDLWYFNFSKMRFISSTWIDTKPKFFSSYSTHDYTELK